MESFSCDCGGIIEPHVKMKDADGSEPWLCQCNKCKDISLLEVIT